ncbi:hypothetical protein IG631_07737 [Alternaria alternata]|nr:hypothetical protein IG631_07737 [Alternaria alternata]
MPDNTSSDESLPSGSHPSAQPEPVARFQSYAEYLACLDRSPFQPRYRSDEEQLWLASFTEDGRYIKRYTCILPDTMNSTNLPSVDVEGIRPDTTVLSPSDFRTLLQTTDESVSYRIVIAASDHIEPPRMLEDVLGLGLDLEPEIFDYVKSTVEDISYMPPVEFPLPWFKDAPALRIGSDVLCILERKPERRSKTGTREDTSSTIRLANHVYSDHISETR